MARPANVDSRETRRRILGAAATLFAAHGSGHTSIRDVARRSRVSVATVHFHFRGKDRLWDACIEAMHEELAGLAPLIAAALEGDRAGGDGERLRAAASAVYRFALDHRPAIRLLLRSVLETGEIGSRRREERLLPFLEGAAALLHPRTGRPPSELRLALQSVVFLFGRYAVASDAELSAVAGLPASTSPERIHARIESHLADAAARLLGL